MGAERDPFDWQTWMWWISLTALSTTAAYVFLSIVVSVFGAAVADATADGQQVTMAMQLTLAPFFFAAGAIVGAGQWFVLRGLIVRSGWWMPATAAGWTAGYLWSNLLFPLTSDPVSNFSLFSLWLLIGLTTGLCQWMVLRLHYERSALWVPAAIVAAALGASGWLLGGLFGWALLWLLAAAFSGWVLLRALSSKRLGTE